MKKLLKRFGAMFVVVAMLVAMIPMTVLADDPENGFYLQEVKKEKGTDTTVYTKIETKGDIVVGKGQKDKDKDNGVIKFFINGEKTDFTYSDLSAGKSERVDSYKLPQDNKGYTVIDINESEATITLKVKDEGYYVGPSEEAAKVSTTKLVKGSEVAANSYIAKYDKDGKMPEDLKIKFATGGEKTEKNPYRVDNKKYKVSEDPKAHIDLVEDTSKVARIITPPTLVPDFQYTDDEVVLLDTVAVADENGTPMYFVTTENLTEAPATTADGWKADKSEVTGKDAGTYYLWYYAKKTTDGYLDSEVFKLDNPVTINPKEVEEPVANEGLVYDGTPKTGTTYSEDDSDIIEATGDLVKTDAKENPYGISMLDYRAIFNLIDTKNYVWKTSGTTDPVVVGWSIAQRTLKPETDLVYTAPTNLKYDGEAKEATVELSEGLTNPGIMNVFYKNAKDEFVDPEDTYLPGKYSVYAEVVGGGDSNFKLSTDLHYVGSFEVKGVKIIAGDKGVFTQGTDETLKITANGPYNEETYSEEGREFNGLKVRKVGDKEWKKLTKDKDYTVEKGSTKVTLSNDYLKKLDAGEYELLFAYDSQGTKANVTAVATFTVKEAAESPKTADTNTTWLWIFLSVLGGLAVIAGAYKTIGSDI